MSMLLIVSGKVKGKCGRIILLKIGVPSEIKMKKHVENLNVGALIKRKNKGRDCLGKTLQAINIEELGNSFI